MSDRTSALVLPLSIVVSVAVGVALGEWFARGNSTPPASASLSIGEAKDLREAMGQFVQAAGDLTSSVKRSDPKPPPVFPKVQPDPAWIDADLARSSQELNKSYLFWTYQQVADHGGAPESTGREKGDSVYWFYKSEKGGVLFWFADGRVYSVEARPR